jgi:3-isopropylmalate/(R)-2-methylmalate dehydratase small subunit
LITRENFGSGSSREAAVYALVDFGIKAVFAPSFGDIFSSNAVNNGLLPARLTEAEIDALIDTLGGDDAAAFVDLEKGEAEIAGTKLRFSVDPVWQQKLINGWDDIDMTAQYAAQITEFRGKRLAAHPWAMPTTD